MMSEPDNITRCPFCLTSFRVIDVQLQAANGAVRCGSCLQVFQARDYFVVVEAEATTETATAKVAATSVATDREIRSNLEAIADSEDYLEDRAVLEELIKPEISEALGSLSESPGLAFIDGSDTRTIAVTDEIDAPALSGTENSPDDGGAARDAGTSASLTGASALASMWYNAMDLPEQLPLGDAADLKSAAPDSVTVNNDAAAEASTSWGVETDLPTTDSTNVDITNLDIAQLDIARETPQEIVGIVSAPRQKSWPWIIAGLALMAVLGGQYAWYGKDVLAQDATVRPYYHLVCGYLGCRLPVYRNRRAIEATDLVVRSQQNDPPALIVDAIIKNSGAFRQVFPDLELQFTDAENRLVAGRRFSPAEYLAGEMTGMSYFPAYTEVRLSLEIVDPGDDALGYSLAIAPDS
jgi:predicted Zn finger-like uncharacterized protein